LEDDAAKPKDNRDTHWADLTVPLPFTGDVMRAVSGLFNRAWFERLWIYQEARLEGDRVIMQCGQYRIEWQSWYR
jgi:hypothetical protein